MTRYYYDDPLAAAWMAKHFGMKFEDSELRAAIRRVKKDMPPTDWRDPGNYISNQGWLRDGYYFYIHPDSLHLLEPRKGDAIKGLFWDQSCWIMRDDATIEHLNNCTACIIQRNGIAFHWPKVEKEAE